MKKLLALGIVVVIAISCAFIGTSMIQEKATQDKVTIYSSSPFYTEDQLLILSDLIVKAKVIKVKDKFTKEMDDTNSNGIKVNVIIPFIVYELEVIEDEYLKNSSGNNKIEVVLPDGDRNNDKAMTIGEESIFFLQNSPRQDVFKGAYIPISLDQGIYSTEDANGQIASRITNSQLNYTNLKEKLKDKH